jgi:hypothetical protein
MSISKIYAHVSCSDLDRSSSWFQRLFGRAADARPMDGLAEWHHGDAGLQVWRDAAEAGHGTVTLIVTGLVPRHRGMERLGQEARDFVVG